jgi:hypothetical protein
VRWTCPQCDREFARARQSHVCVPGCTVDETFADHPAGQRAAYDAVVEHLRREGPVHEDAVRIGVFLKSEGKIAELRPKARGLTLLLFLAREVDDVRIRRRETTAQGRVMHTLRLLDAADVDDVVRAWLSEAYAAADA